MFQCLLKSGQKWAFVTDKTQVLLWIVWFLNPAYNKNTTSCHKAKLWILPRWVSCQCSHIPKIVAKHFYLHSTHARLYLEPARDCEDCSCYRFYVFHRDHLPSCMSLNSWWTKHSRCSTLLSSLQKIPCSVGLSSGICSSRIVSYPGMFGSNAWQYGSLHANTYINCSSYSNVLVHNKQLLYNRNLVH